MQGTILEIPEVRVTKISVNDYEMLCRNNPGQYEKTELFEGVIIEKMTKSSGHIFFKHYLVHEFQRILPGQFFIQTEDSIRLGESVLEPDISIIAGSFMDYRNSIPEAARLIAEISVSSLKYDREKARVYAKAKVPEYWIIDVENRKVEVYSDPENEIYKSKIIYNFLDEIPVFERTVSLKNA